MCNCNCNDAACDSCRPATTTDYKGEPRVTMSPECYAELLRTQDAYRADKAGLLTAMEELEGDGRRQEEHIQYLRNRITTLEATTPPDRGPLRQQVKDLQAAARTLRSDYAGARRREDLLQRQFNFLKTRLMGQAEEASRAVGSAMMMKTN